MGIFPPQMRAQLDAAPDSQIPMFVRNVVRNEMVVRQADSAKITLDTAEMNDMRRSYEQVITNAWTQIGIEPKMLADSSKTEAGRDKLAATRVEDYLTRILVGQARPINVPPTVSQVMRARYGSKINEAGVDRVVTLVTQARKAADSTRNAAMPPSAVPLPGVGGGAPGSSGPPPGGRQPSGGGNR